MIKPKKKYKIKFEFLLFLIVAVLGVIYIRYTWLKIEREELNEIRQNVLSIEASLDKNILDSLNASPEDATKNEYLELKQKLIDIIEVNENARFIYIYVLRNEKLYFIADSEPEDSKDISPPGQEYTEAALEYYEPFKTGLPVITSPVKDRWGTWISVLVPFKDKNGNITAVVGMDYDANFWNTLLWVQLIESSVLVLLTIFAISISLKIRARNKKLKTEIVERIQAEKELEQNKKQLSDIIEFLPDATFAVDKSRKVFIWNKAIELLTGVKAENMIGKTKEEYLLPFYGKTRNSLIDIIFNDISVEDVHYENVIVEDDTFHAQTFCENLDNGKGAWVYVKASPLYDTKGLLIGAIESVRDITSQKMIEVELLHAKEKAEESDRLKSAFLANMSHEIRTPMNSILGFADLLKEPMLSGEKQAEYIRIIEKSGARMLGIINDIIDISKIEAGLMPIKKSYIDVNEQINTVFALFKSEAEKKGLNIYVAPPLPVEYSTINTDREKLYAVLINLVKNAIKFTNVGEIEFGLKKADNFLHFFVRDTGIGIPKVRQNAVFDRFIQADVLDSNAYQGAGLGLSISKAYVEMLGGEINLISEEGKGSEFIFTIPYEPYFEGINKHSSNNLKQFNKTKQLLILIAEDDESSAYFLKQRLEKYSHKIILAKNGKEAVDLYDQKPEIDLILMDIKMPVLNGYEALKQIRKSSENVIIIAQTAYALSSDEDFAIKSGFNAHIAKPIKIEKLLKIIETYFANK